MLFYVTDLVPLCSTLLTLKLSGFGDAFGPFLAEELARGLGRINKVLTTLELAYNAIGDRGAEGLALALGQNRTLTYSPLRIVHSNLTPTSTACPYICLIYVSPLLAYPPQKAIHIAALP